jgi:hypothetical protein
VGGAAMFTCLSCDAKFDEPYIKEIWDAYDAHGSYAVSYFDVQVCPRCYNEEFEEVEW